MKHLQDILTESLLDDEDEIAKGVEAKYSVPNLIKNLGNTRDPEKYQSVGDIIKGTRLGSFFNV